MAFCAKCGADLQAGAAFCSKCGAPVSQIGAPIPPSATAGPGQPTYGYGYGYEKHEKREKQTQQAEKSEKGEKQQDRSGPLVGGAILILLGIIFYATLTTPPLIVSSQFGWYFLLGIGIILVGQAVYRFASMKHHAAAMGSLWGGVILIAIGAAGIEGSGNFWPIVLIAIGIMVIIAGLTARSRTPRP